MQWKDEGYLLFKNNFDENSIIIDAFTLNHGKYTGVVYGGSSRKLKKIFQVGNKISLNWKSKSENKIGYFNIELIKPVSPLFFDNKEKSICILSASTILKILLPERQINKKIFESYEKLLNSMFNKNWINNYINWEIFIIKELGYDVNIDVSDKVKNKALNFIKFNNKNLKIPKFYTLEAKKTLNKNDIYEALRFNKLLLVENFIVPNQLKLPLSRNILEKYYK